ncbi:MAG: ribonuclease III [Candidatus Edwardsbacteria bacterium]
MFGKSFFNPKKKNHQLPLIRRQQLKELQKRLNLHFKNLTLLNQSLCHRSFVSGKNGESNERLEFLGDAVLGLIVCEYLYQTFPEKSEGELSELKSLLVSQKILAKRAQEISLGDYLLLSLEEKNSGGRRKASIISDAFEALIGATFLDSGLKTCKELVYREILSKAQEIVSAQEHINYKSFLLEYVQAHFLCQPEYCLKGETGPEHQKIFEVEVKIKGKCLGKGLGQSKKQAEQEAAKEAFLILKKKEE